jgi:hypothetical protein
MPLSTADLQRLKTELQTDPATVGYAALGQDYEALARLINRQQRSIDRETLTSGMLVSCLDLVEFTALSAANKAWLNLFVQANEVPMTNDVRVSLRALFPAGSKTRQAINQATKRTGSRADELGLVGVTESDVAEAILRTT